MYDVNRLVPILTSVLGSPNHQYSNNEFYFYCPFCSHKNPRFAVNLGSGKWHCWVCGASGNKLTSLFYKLDVPREYHRELRDALGEEIFYAPSPNLQESELSLPAEFKPLWKLTKEIESLHAVAYLKRRGLTAYDILRYRMGYVTEGIYANRIIIPSYDTNGKLNMFAGRDFFDVSPRPYRLPPVSKNVIGFEDSINWTLPIVICEGVFDAMSIKWNAIPLFGKFISEKLAEKIVTEGVEDIYVSLDSDALKQSAKIIQKFLKEGRIVHLVQFEEKDPSLAGFQRMQNYIRNAKRIEFRDLIALKLA